MLGQNCLLPSNSPWLNIDQINEGADFCNCQWSEDESKAGEMGVETQKIFIYAKYSMLTDIQGWL